jgi:hypothetical protein
MSILYSTIRIIPKTLGLRRTAYYCAMLFGCMWTALMIQKSIICGRDTVWQRKPQPQCHLGLQVGVLELVSKRSDSDRISCHLLKYHCVADCISDCILVIIPLRLLWNVNLPRNLRKLLFTIFSASILVTAVSVVHAAFVLGPSGSLEGISANVEVCIPFSAKLHNQGLTGNANAIECCVIDGGRPCSDHDILIPLCQRARDRSCLGRFIGLRYQKVGNALVEGFRGGQHVKLSTANAYSPLQLCFSSPFNVPRDSVLPQMTDRCVIHPHHYNSSRIVYAETRPFFLQPYTHCPGCVRESPVE